jgi:hypothetical protein
MIFSKSVAFVARRVFLACPPAWFYIMAACIGILLFLARGLDANYDLQNYHISSAMLFLRGSTWDNVLPSNIQTYLNPLVLLPNYVLLSTVGFTATRIVWILMHSAFFAIMLGAFWGVLRQERLDAVDAYPLWLGALCGIFGVIAPLSLSTVGTSFTDLPTNTLVALSLFEVVRTGFSPSLWRGFRIAVPLGITVGLKLTALVVAFPFGVAFYTVLAVLSDRRRAVLDEFIVFGLTAAGVTAAIAGPWMFVVWHETGNPLFPFFNDIFESQYFSAQDWWRDDRLVPKTLSGYLAAPLGLIKGEPVVAEISLRDIRWAVYGYLALPFLLAAAAIAQTRGGNFLRQAPYTTFLVLFSVLIYLIWAPLFHIGRFILVFDVLCGLLIVRTALVVPGRTGLVLASVLALAHFGVAKVGNWGGGKKTLDGTIRVGDAPRIRNEALIFYATEPMGYMATYFGEAARFVLLWDPTYDEFNFDTTSTGPYARKVKSLINRNWPDGMWMVAPRDRKTPFGEREVRYVQGYHLALTDHCQDVTSWASHYIMCQVTRQSPP